MTCCHYCGETATQRCGICNRPVCDRHKHAVNRWHNVFHASWICEECYQAKERKRRYVLLPVILVFVVFIAKSMNVRWGLYEPTTWYCFFALSCVLLVVTGVAAIYNAVKRTSKVKKWLVSTLGAFVLWSILYYIYLSLAG